LIALCKDHQSARETAPTSLLGFLAQEVADRQFPWETPPTPFLAFLSGKTQRLSGATQAAVTDQRLVDQRLASSAIRTLVAGLVLLALLPSIMLGAIFLLGAIHTPWSTPLTHSPNESFVPAAMRVIPPAAPTVSAEFVTDQLKKLGELRDAGLLSNDEFNTKKAELLARL